MLPWDMPRRQMLGPWVCSPRILTLHLIPGHLIHSLPHPPPKPMIAKTSPSSSCLCNRLLKCSPLKVAPASLSLLRIIVLPHHDTAPPHPPGERPLQQPPPPFPSLFPYLPSLSSRHSPLLTTLCFDCHCCDSDPLHILCSPAPSDHMPPLMWYPTKSFFTQMLRERFFQPSIAA